MVGLTANYLYKNVYYGIMVDWLKLGFAIVAAVATLFVMGVVFLTFAFTMVVIDWYGIFAGTIYFVVVMVIIITIVLYHDL